MTGPENEVLRRCRESIESFNEDDKHFVDFLSDRQPAFRLTQDRRRRLYRLGNKVGIDGEKLYARTALAKAEERVKL